MIKFDLPEEQENIIKVIGVGGGGSNAVNHMYNQGITGVDFIICNTDAQALNTSPVPNRIQIGATLTEGRGAGAKPEKGKNAAIEDIEEIKAILEKNTQMLFITAGMGGGTGTGAAPVIAAVAKELGILTVAIVTQPFGFEGKLRKQKAEAGIEELKKNVDSLLIICNDKVREVYGNQSVKAAFSKADDILSIGAKGIAEIITVPGYINVDFADVKTVMSNSGVALMGTGVAEGEDRAIKAIEMALSSPLLNDNNIEGAENILLYISSGKEDLRMDEITGITEYIQDEAGLPSEIIWGNGEDEALENSISITIVATGFDPSSSVNNTTSGAVKKEPKRHELGDVLNVGDNTKVDNKINNNITNLDIAVENKGNYNEKKSTETNYPSIQSDKKEITRTDSITDIVKAEKEESIGTEKVQTSNDDFLKTQERLKQISIVKDHGSIADMENSPAYMRKNITLSDVAASDESSVSRYSLDEGEDKKVELKDNTFLHDNVD